MTPELQIGLESNKSARHARDTGRWFAVANDTVAPQSGSRFLTGVLRASAATMVVVASRVCIVTETYAPEINGVASTLARLASGMRERGHTVSLVRPRQPAVDVRGRRPTPGTLLVPGMRLPGYKGLQLGFPAGAGLRAGHSRLQRLPHEFRPIHGALSRGLAATPDRGLPASLPQRDRRYLRVDRASSRRDRGRWLPASRCAR